MIASSSDDAWGALESNDHREQSKAIAYFLANADTIDEARLERAFGAAPDRFPQILLLRLIEELKSPFATNLLLKVVTGIFHPQVKFEACLALIDRDELAARGVLAKFLHRKWANAASQYLEFRSGKSEVGELLAVAMLPRNIADANWSSIRMRIEPEIAAYLEQNPEQRRDHYLALLASVEFDDSAIEYFMDRPEDITFEELVRIYTDFPEMVRRCEVIEIVGQKLDRESGQFLIEVARSRANSVVRYYAMLALIRRGSPEWRPQNARRLRTPLFASLATYEQYVKGVISIEEVHARATENSTWPGDHWAWLRELEAEPTVAQQC